MRADERAGTEVDARIAAADQLGGRMLARRSARARQNERQARTGGIAVVLSLFVALLVAALLAGGHGLLDPLLGAATDAREAKRAGDIVFAMPDRTFCRHLSFDNMTAELTEGSIEHCPHVHSSERPRAPTGFAWGARSQ